MVTVLGATFPLLLCLLPLSSRSRVDKTLPMGPVGSVLRGSPYTTRHVHIALVGVAAHVPRLGCTLTSAQANPGGTQRRTSRHERVYRTVRTEEAVPGDT